MQVLLDIPNQSAWNALQPLIQYLHIEVIEQDEIKEKISPKKLHFIKKRSEIEQKTLESLISKGINVVNIDALVSDFEDSRLDRKLPFRD